ncbi:MAG: hypothetical protein NTY19_20085 [Planctomycetota bacterium]|nr:hypothetical protein [Planctomycetota bacterium]
MRGTSSGCKTSLWAWRVSRRCRKKKANKAYQSLVQFKKNGAMVFELLRGQTPGSAGGSQIPLWSTP